MVHPNSLKNLIYAKKGDKPLNPYGRPRKPEIELVRNAIVDQERKHKQSLWSLLIEKCYTDNQVLIAVAKKFLPDKIENDIKQTDLEAKELERVVEARITELMNKPN